MDTTQTPEPQNKTPYQTPEVSDLGSIETTTQFTSPGIADGQSGSTLD